MTKKQFLKTLKKSPYSDELIEYWMDTFADDSITDQYLKAIKHDNELYDRMVPQIECRSFVEALYASYVRQGIPHPLIVPLMICSKYQVRVMFLAIEYSRMVEITQIGGATIIDMSKEANPILS